MRNAALDPMLLIGAHHEQSLTDTVRQQDTNRESLLELQGRVAALSRQLGVSLPDCPPTAPRREPSGLPIREFSDLLAQARRASPPTRHPADLFSPTLQRQALHRHHSLKRDVVLSRTLDIHEVTAAGLAGLISALVSAIWVDVPRHPGFLGGKASPGGPLSNWVRSQIDASVPDATRRVWEAAYHVPYDAAHSGGLHNAVAGLSPNSHRFQSLGHDPLLGLVFGVRDLMRGEFTAIDAAGRVIVNRTGTGVAFWEAFLTFVMHLASDATTTRGLPIPGMPLLQLIQKGSFGPQKYTVAQLATQMYRQNYDLRHGVAMTLPVFLTEILVRTFYLFDQLRRGRSLQEALPLWSQPKLNRILLVAHGVATAGNLGKVILTRNPLAINAPQWAALAAYAVPEISWQLWGKHRELQRLIDEDFATFHAQYEHELTDRPAFYL